VYILDISRNHGVDEESLTEMLSDYFDYLVNER
jgi:hypothetical protein